MLRRRSSEVMDRTQSRTGHALDPTRLPYALHVGLTRRLPDNWLSSQLVTEDNQLSGRHDVKRHIERAASTHRKGSVTFGQHQ